MNRIKSYRTERGLQQKDLANAVGVTPGHMSHLESETRNPSMATMALIADALGKTIVEVFYPNEAQILARKESDTVKLEVMYQSDATAELVVIQDGQAVTTSLKVAEYFGKDHNVVLRSIRNTLTSIPSDFSACNFAQADYTDDQGKPRPMYFLTRDGFVLVAMGYTGVKAMQFKVAYITAFNKMEAMLQRKPEPLTNEEVTDRAAHKLAVKLFPEFVKTITPQLTKEIIAQVRSLPHGETLIPTTTAIEQPKRQDINLPSVTHPSLDWLPNVLTVDHIRAYLNIGRKQAYELVHSEGFPSIKVGTAIRIEKVKFLKWLDNKASSFNG